VVVDNEAAFRRVFQATQKMAVEAAHITRRGDFDEQSEECKNLWGAVCSVGRAVVGDWSVLATRLRTASPSDLRPEETALAADILEGRLKRPKHRTKKHNDIWRSKEVFDRVEMYVAEGKSRKAAVSLTAEDFGYKVRRVEQFRKMARSAKK
jgi:hypothetical protein